MKKTILCVIASATILMGLSVYAQGAVIIKETPVVITPEGDRYVVPATYTGSYYYYTQSNTRYVCTSTVPSELVSVTGVPLAVSVGDVTRDVQCYPDTYFTIQAN